MQIVMTRSKYVRKQITDALIFLENVEMTLIAKAGRYAKRIATIAYQKQVFVQATICATRILKYAIRQNTFALRNLVHAITIMIVKHMKYVM
jgi:hypothetical protein